MPITRHALRLAAVLAGFAAGFGAAVLLTGVDTSDPDKPACPRCGRRHSVDRVTYSPARPDGPLWCCTRCPHWWGSRFAPPGR